MHIWKPAIPQSSAQTSGGAYIYIYIYIYIFHSEKQQTGHIRIMNLFPSCYAFLKNAKTRKKFNRTSSAPLDKKKSDLRIYLIQRI